MKLGRIELRLRPPVLQRVRRRGGAHGDRRAVGGRALRLHEDVHRRHAIGARHVADHDWRIAGQILGEKGRNYACGRISAAAGGKADDEADGDGGGAASTLPFRT